MSTAPRPPLLGRVSPRARTRLGRWGLGLFPIALAAMFLSGPSDPGPGPFAPYLVHVLVMVLPAGLLRRRPMTALAMMLLPMAVVATVFQPLYGAGYLYAIRNVQILAVDLAVAFIAANHARRTSLTAVGLTLFVQLVCAVYYGSWGQPYSRGTPFLTIIAFMLLALAVAWQVGSSVRQRREYADARRAQAAVQAVQAERLRIARELHDMIAHSIGVIAIQAGMGSRVIDTQPMEARNALTVIEDTSRETLAGLRRMLGTLRRADASAAPTDVSPGLADLGRLAERSLNAGVRVDLRRRGSERTLPPDLDLSAYRIVQEAVTNVIRHSGATECRVVLDHRDDELFIEVTDDGRGGVPGDGYGIPGMRERVSLLHGDFAAGPCPGRGFQVTARIPVPEDVR